MDTPTVPSYVVVSNGAEATVPDDHENDHDDHENDHHHHHHHHHHKHQQHPRQQQPEQRHQPFPTTKMPSQSSKIFRARTNTTTATTTAFNRNGNRKKKKTNNHHHNNNKAMQVRSMVFMALSGIVFCFFLELEEMRDRVDRQFDDGTDTNEKNIVPMIHSTKTRPDSLEQQQQQQHHHNQIMDDPYFQWLSKLDSGRRCVDDRDDDDAIAWKQQQQQQQQAGGSGSGITTTTTSISISTTTPCQCTDPTIARAGTRKRWMEFHQTLVEQANGMTTNPSAYDDDDDDENDDNDDDDDDTLDVLLLGDSITERWRGSMFAGKTPAQKYARVFRQYFSPSSSSSLRGAAFGGSGDTAVELLYHLRNGMLPKHVRPRAVMILIGTNDVGRIGCSPGNALAGILHVARYVQEKRPTAQLIVHGLLPRNDASGNGNHTVGATWQQLRWINTRLQRYCAWTASVAATAAAAATTTQRHTNDPHRRPAKKPWRYIDNGNLFFADGDTINATLMEDALHPSLEGYRVWGARLVVQIQEILNHQPEPQE